MLLAWLRRGEIFRAQWLGWSKMDNMRIFHPFAGSAYHAADLRVDGTRTMSLSAFLSELGKGGQDDLDLFLHEAWHHGIRDRKDLPGVKGLGSNDMARRAQTTTPEERREARAELLALVDTVHIHGLK